jgi:tellurite resistance protein TerC
MSLEVILWIVFSFLVLGMLYVDLYVTDHSHGEKSLKSAIVWSGIWIGVALLFNVFIYFFYDNNHQAAFEYLAAYLIEKSLSVDNLFVFILIFKSLDIPYKNQPHVLKWGILTAIVFRIAFILLGVQLINLFKPTIFIFGLILFYAAYKMFKEAISHEEEEKELNLADNIVVGIINRFFVVDTLYTEHHFFYRHPEKNKIFATPLFVAFLLVESADIIFAVDSVPAVLAITHDPFIAITSNIMAILGLRALFFVLAGILQKFYYLKHGVSLLLLFVGFKLIVSEWYKIPTLFSLSFIIIVLIVSIILSIMKNKSEISKL